MLKSLLCMVPIVNSVTYRDDEMLDLVLLDDRECPKCGHIQNTWQKMHKNVIPIYNAQNVVISRIHCVPAFVWWRVKRERLSAVTLIM